MQKLVGLQLYFFVARVFLCLCPSQARSEGDSMNERKEGQNKKSQKYLSSSSVQTQRCFAQSKHVRVYKELFSRLSMCSSSLRNVG
ncbi:MAG: hypothetical protein JOS17DRAFT_102439 [Linnemannia elongata]|nr:MAG: hypothetical protein JOS17DRAFT_102439 [Linnemannia elongata]